MKATLQIQNLKCGGCEKTIINKLNTLKNISDVSIHQEKSSVSFKYLINEDINLVKKSLSKIGYPIVGDNNHIGKKATSYISCAIGKMQ